SVLRLRCLNFQASLAVLATRQRMPSSAQRSWTQPANRQASMMTTVGRSLARSRCISLRVVSKLVKRKGPAASAGAQATLLNLPRSMARMVPAAAVLAVVVIVQAPWGDGGGEVW